MSTILVTGASGYVGKAIVTYLKDKDKVLAMSRKDPEVDGVTFISGNFACEEDLKQLDSFKIDKVIHLAAVTGGCSERDGILVNVEGTRVLMRYLIDQGCKKFVMASSIAVVGFQNIKFRPVELPMPDEHPCLDRDGYGVSKYLMEEVTKYYQLQNEDIDVINLRLAAICAGEPGDLNSPGALCEWAIGGIAVMVLEDAVKVFVTAAEAEYQPGVRILNATASQGYSQIPTAQVLKTWYGDDVDVSYFEQPGNEYASVYDVSKIEQELGFVAENTLAHIASRML